MKKYVSFLLILFGISSSVLAAQASVAASGNISSTCSFTNVALGTLAVSPNQPSTITTSPSRGGSYAVVNVEYLGTPTITFLTPTAFDDEPNASTTMSKNFTVGANSQRLGTLTGDSTSISGTYSTNSTDTIDVLLQADFVAANVPLGAYTMSTMATCQ